MRAGHDRSGRPGTTEALGFSSTGQRVTRAVSSAGTPWTPVSLLLPVAVAVASDLALLLATSLSFSQGLDVTVAGRNAASVRALALELGLPSVSFSLDNEAALDEAVGRAAVVVHCAGPFAQTYSAVVESCLRKGAHYVDINGEIEVIEAISKYAQEAEEKGLMLLPAAGFDVVPSDTLAHLVAEKFKSCYPAHFPSKLEIFFHYNDQGKLFPRSLSSLFAASDLISLSLSL